MTSLESLVGRWSTSGNVLGDDGEATAVIEGTDEYEWMPGGNWLIHRVDVTIGGDPVRALELIGEPGRDGDSWVTRAFDASGAYDRMTLKQKTDGTFVLAVDGMRSTLVPDDGNGRMTALWERESAPGAWARWMDMTFRRID